jgi:uncharacterized membrane protein
MRATAKKPGSQYDLLVAMGAGVAFFATTCVDDLLILQRLLSLFVLLIVPGYLSLVALYPSPDEMNVLERLAGSMALSVAITSLLGLALNQTPLGIGIRTFMGSYIGITSLLAVLASYRRRKLTQRETRCPPRPDKPLPVPGGHACTARILGTGALITLITALYYVALFPPQQKVSPTTQFYLESESSNLDDLTLSVRDGQPITVIIGLINLENRPTEYEIYRHTEGEPDIPVAAVKLDSGQNWEMPYTFSFPAHADSGDTDRQISFYLYKDSDIRTPYRTTYLWLKP